MDYQEFSLASAKDLGAPRLYRLWAEDPERAVAWMDDRVFSDIEVSLAREWNGGKSGRPLIAVPTALLGEDVFRVVEVLFAPLGEPDVLPPELDNLSLGGRIRDRGPVGRARY